MIPLNVSFGIYVLLPQGWAFMITIILIECLGLSYILTKKWYSRKAYKTAIFPNLISGIIGFIGSIVMNGGWWLVVWFPWVSYNEVRGPEGFKSLAIFYGIAFVLTLLIEGLVNYLILKNDFKKSKIMKTTIIVNIISYAIGSSAMYSYSF